VPIGIQKESTFYGYGRRLFASIQSEYRTDNLSDRKRIRSNEKMEYLQQRSKSMTGKTSTLAEEIRRKVISKITKNPEFKNKDEVIEAAMVNYYNQLKKEKIL